MTKNHSNFPLPTYYGYFCQRYYDPQIGRFMTLDPFGGYIERPQTQNRYAYCMNNPLKYIDPLGLYEVYPFLEKPPMRDIVFGYKYTPPTIEEELNAWGCPLVRGNKPFGFELPTTPPGMALQVIKAGQYLQNFPHWTTNWGGRILQLWGYYSIGRGVERSLKEIFHPGQSYFSSPFNYPDFTPPQLKFKAPAGLAIPQFYKIILISDDLY